MTDPYAQWDAGYVLGALPAAQRREYEHHLAGCAHCRHQVAELSGMPGLLALARAEEAGDAPLAGAADVAAHAPLYAGLAARVARRRRRLFLAAAAGVLAVAGTTAAVTTGIGPATAPPPSAASSVAAGFQLTFAGASPQGLQVTGTLVSHPWGTQIDWQCSYAPAALYAGDPAGREYSLVMVSPTGAESTVASWMAGPGSEVTPTATIATPVGSIARLDIRDSAGTTLLSAVTGSGQ